MLPNFALDYFLNILCKVNSRTVFIPSYNTSLNYYFELRFCVWVMFPSGLVTELVEMSHLNPLFSFC